LHFSVLFVSIPGCCCCFSPLEGEVKTHHLISLKKDADILIGFIILKGFQVVCFHHKIVKQSLFKKFFWDEKEEGTAVRFQHRITTKFQQCIVTYTPKLHVF
jgi:hypothetical protein